MLDIRWIHADSLSLVEQILRQRGTIAKNDTIVQLDSAGEGNMNVTLRATIQGNGSQRNVIVKQSRPFVAKYDSIPAPLERAEFEAAFYREISTHPDLAARMPQLLAWIPEEFLLVLEDLGPNADATSLYQQRKENHSFAELRELLQWIVGLHASTRGIETEPKKLARFENRALRQLNHAHIFDLPFQDAPVCDLDQIVDGLASSTNRIRTSDLVRSRAQELGSLYLGEQNCDRKSLLHGDYYPGSWLYTEAGPRIIDPEFCFVGPPEFDLGVFLAHLQFIARTRDVHLADRWLQDELAPTDDNYDTKLIRDFAAIEVLRRLLGVAQLPLLHTLDERIALVEQAYEQLGSDK